MSFLTKGMPVESRTERQRTQYFSNFKDAEKWKKSKIWKPKNQLFSDEKAITSLRLNLFQQSKVW